MMAMVPPKVFPMITNFPSGLTGVCTGNPPIRPARHFPPVHPVDRVVALNQGDVVDLLPGAYRVLVPHFFGSGPFMTDIECPR